MKNKLKHFLLSVIHEALRETEHNLTAIYSLKDLDGQKIGIAHLTFKPSVGDIIRLDDDTFATHWPAYRVLSVEYNQSGSTGTLIGTIEKD